MMLAKTQLGNVSNNGPKNKITNKRINPLNNGATIVLLPRPTKTLFLDSEADEGKHFKNEQTTFVNPQA
jgi:hypothetical protein